MATERILEVVLDNFNLAGIRINGKYAYKLTIKLHNYKFIVLLAKLYIPKHFKEVNVIIFQPNFIPDKYLFLKLLRN
jgi:hypothetical protein